MKGITRRMTVLALAGVVFMSGIPNPAHVEAKLAKPVVSVSKRTKTSATIKITKVNKATGYQVYFASSKNGSYTKVGTTKTTSYKRGSLKSNKVYYVKVRAYKKTGSKTNKGLFSKVVKIGKVATTTEADQYGKKVVNLVNAERKKQGLSELKEDSLLNKAASTRAKELISKFSHTRPNGKDGLTALTDLGISYLAAGENIAAGQSTPQSVMSAWMASAGHKANILSDDYTSIGVGYYYSSKAQHYFWVQIFKK